MERSCFSIFKLLVSGGFAEDPGSGLCGQAVTRHLQLRPLGERSGKWVQVPAAVGAFQQGSFWVSQCQDPTWPVWEQWPPCRQHRAWFACGLGCHRRESAPRLDPAATPPLCGWAVESPPGWAPPPSGGLPSDPTRIQLAPR